MNYLHEFVLLIMSLDKTLHERLKRFGDTLFTVVQHWFGSCCATVSNERATFWMHPVTSISTS